MSTWSLDCKMKILGCRLPKSGSLRLHDRRHLFQIYHTPSPRISNKTSRDRAESNIARRCFHKSCATDVTMLRLTLPKLTEVRMQSLQPPNYDILKSNDVGDNNNKISGAFHVSLS
jgi:hypothetical protein